MKERIENFEVFSKFEEVAEFLLLEAFKYVHSAAEYEVAGILFEEFIMSIVQDAETSSDTEQLNNNLPTSSNKNSECKDEIGNTAMNNTLDISNDTTNSKPKQNHEWPISLTEWVKHRDKMIEDVSDDDSTVMLAEAWQTAQQNAGSSDRRLLRTHTFKSIDMIGHIINLSACIEAVINRKLYFLRESNKLDNHHYISLDRTELMPKILFIFKEEIFTKNLFTTRLKHLITLRNEAVHYKESSITGEKLNTVTPEELLGIWGEVATLFELVEGLPTKDFMIDLINEFRDKWLLN
ncbi:MAG: hypothetical protein ALAOOOJD_02613 [bacterium]|nr:hypothetical protein [bacterium]